MKRFMSIVLALVVIFVSTPISAYSPKAAVFKNISQQDMGISFDLGPNPTTDNTIFNDFRGNFFKYTGEDGGPVYSVEILPNSNPGQHEEFAKLPYFASGNNSIITAAEPKDLIAKALSYGYDGTARYGPDTQAQHNSEYLATQIMVWIISGGLYNRGAEQENVLNLFIKNCPSDVKSIFTKIDKQMKEHIRFPSFSYQSVALVDPIEMPYIPAEKQFKIILESTTNHLDPNIKPDSKDHIIDENGVVQPMLKYFSLSSDESAFTLVKSPDGRSITLTSPFANIIHNSSNGIKLTRTSSEYIPSGLNQYPLKFYKNKTDPGNPDKVSARLNPNNITEVDPDIWNPAYVKVYRPFGQVRLTKQDQENASLLAGAKFQLFHSIDETPVSTNNEVTTNQMGLAVITNIPVSPRGSFYLKETLAPSGYELDPTEHQFEISRDGEIVEVTLQNKARVGSVRGTKTDQDGLGLPGATIGVFDAANPTTPISQVVSEADGTYTFLGLRHGNYIIKEISPPPGYELSTQQINVTIGPDIANENIILDQTQNIVNVRKLYKIQGLKIDMETRKNLAGAEFTLFKGRFPSPTSEAVSVATSGEDGIFIFNDVPLGEYHVRETKAPNGYIGGYNINTGSLIYYEIRMNTPPPNDIWLIVNGAGIPNIPIRTSISGIKVDSVTTNSLSGATIALYKDQDLSNPISQVTTLNDGRFSFDNLLYGKYIIKEIAAPEGYILTDKIFEVTIDDKYIEDYKMDPKKLEIVIKNTEVGTVDPDGETFDPTDPGPGPEYNKPNNQSPNTKDNSNILIYISLLPLSLLAFYLAKKKIK